MGSFCFMSLFTAFTAVFTQEAACIERFHEKNRVNILDLKKRIKLIMYKTMPRTVEVRGIVFTTQLQHRAIRTLDFTIIIFLVERKLSAVMR